MSNDLMNNWYKFKRGEKKNHDDSERPIMKGNRNEFEVKKGVNAMGSYQSGVNMAKFQDTLNKLKEYSDMRINKASGDVLKNYQEILKTMGVVSGTPSYDTLSNMISTTFNETSTFPGTVAGAIYGCHTQFKGADVVDAGCTPTCAGAFKASNDSPTCGHKIFIAEPNGRGGFNIESLFNPVREGNAYIYIPRSKDRQFHQPVFDVKTLEFLEHEGVKNLRFIGYDAKSNILVSVNDDFISLESLMPKKARTVPMMTSPIHRENLSRGNSQEVDYTTIFIVGLVILLVLGYFFYFSK